MRALVVFRDELKRSSWIIFIVLGCMLFDAMELVRSFNYNFEYMIGAGWFDGRVNTVSWYIPVAILLALCQSRGARDDFWGSMPYTAKSLYILRLVYGICFIAAVGLVQLALSMAVSSKYAFVIEDLSYIGLKIEGVYAYPMFLLVNVGAYLIANTVYTLVNNRITASAMLFFISIMPEMLISPISRLNDGGYPQILENICELKYLIAFGINDGCDVRGLSYAIYAVVIIFMLYLGIYINGKNAGRGRYRLFYNMAVKVIFILLCVLFCFNIIETLFLQGGF